MNLNPNFDYVGVPVITLAGVEYFIPVLAIRQTRKVVPALMEIMPNLTQISTNPTLIDEATYDRIVSIVFNALTRAYPDVSLDWLLDQPISVVEMVNSLKTIAAQTGLFKKVANAGEAKGEATPPTLTAPSPDIANIPASPGPTL